MQCLTLRADGALLEQIAILAQNLAHKEGKELTSTFGDDYISYSDDIEAYKRGELETFSMDEVLKEIKTW